MTTPNIARMPRGGQLLQGAALDRARAAQPVPGARPAHNVAPTPAAATSRRTKGAQRATDDAAVTAAIARAAGPTAAEAEAERTWAEWEARTFGLPIGEATAQPPERPPPVPPAPTLSTAEEFEAVAFPMLRAIRGGRS